MNEERMLGNPKPKVNVLTHFLNIWREVLGSVNRRRRGDNCPIGQTWRNFLMHLQLHQQRNKPWWWHRSISAVEKTSASKTPFIFDVKKIMTGRITSTCLLSRRQMAAKTNSSTWYSGTIFIKSSCATAHPPCLQNPKSKVLFIAACNISEMTALGQTQIKHSFWVLKIVIEKLFEKNRKTASHSILEKVK